MDEISELPLYDKTGREIRPYDLLKVYHFGRGRGTRYMYKIVKVKDGVLCGFALPNVKNTEHSYRLYTTCDKNRQIPDTEIVDGYYGHEGGESGFSHEDRKKHKFPQGKPHDN